MGKIAATKRLVAVFTRDTLRWLWWKSSRQFSAKIKISLQRFQSDFLDFDIAAFALDGDVAGCKIAAGNPVHLFAVDEQRDGMATANGLVGAPIAGGIFVGRTDLGDVGGAFAGHSIAVRTDAGMQHHITLVLVLALEFDALRPDFVRRLGMDEHAGVVGMRRDFDKAPNPRELVVVVALRGARVAVGPAGAMNHAIGHAPGLFGRRVAPHAKRPAVEIGAVEKFDGGRLWRRGGLAAGQEKKGERKGGRE
jgi:hypothetical protein